MEELLIVHDDSCLGDSPGHRAVRYVRITSSSSIAQVQVLAMAVALIPW